METAVKQKVSWEELGKFYEKLAVKSIEILVSIHSCLLGLEVMSEIRRIKTCERVSGYYRLVEGNKLRWINGYWRKKRTLRERH